MYSRHALTVVVGLACVASLGRAQVTEVARTSIADAAQLTFGHLCEDRFVIRNDGTAPVTLAYGVSKGSEQTTFTIGAREIVELSSKAKQPLELWKDGQRIARAEKERRSCKDVQGTGSVQVSSLEVNSTERPRQNWAGYGPGWGWGWGGAWGVSPWMMDPWLGGWGVRPWGGFVSVPVIVGGRGRRR
jgi:hypothetical protein